MVKRGTCLEGEAIIEAVEIALAEAIAEKKEKRSLESCYVSEWIRGLGRFGVKKVTNLAKYTKGD